MPGSDELTLFLDDDAELTHLYRQRLEARGYQGKAEFATSIEEANRLLEERRITHLVSDWKMPGEDGISYIKAIRKEHPEMQLSILTGFANELEDADRDELASVQIQVYDKQEI